MSTRQSGDYRTSGNGSDTRVEFIPGSLFRIDHWAASPMAPGNLYKRRQSTGALGNAESAPRLERTARGHGLQRWDCAFDGAERLPAIRLQIGDRLQQAARVRMCRRLKDLAHGSEFHH